MNRTVASPIAGQRPSSLLIEAAGLCCSLGYQLDAAVCAIRANMDHFQESGFYSLASEPLNVATLPDDIFGQERLQRWIEYAIRDCAQHMVEPHSLFDAKRTALIVLAPDQSRPHANEQFYSELVVAAMKQFSDTSEHEQPTADHYNITVLQHGRAGLAPALLQTARHLVNQVVEQVLLIGVDSYLNAADINHYLQEKRLFIPDNSNGFLPGEAACALLLRPALASAAGLHIKGVGIAQERGRPDGSVPSRAQGLSEAIRAACAQAKIDPAELDFRLSDQNGEQFFSREAANAVSRVMFGAHKLTHLTLADKIGEVGAATGPAMLAWLMRDMGHPELSPGNTGLVHLANDDGSRCAVVLHHQGEQ